MYEVVDRNTGEIKKVYSLKEKYQYYKNKANNTNAKNNQGEKIGFAGRVALANRANNIKNRMGKNKQRYDYYSKKR